MTTKTLSRLGALLYLLWGLLHIKAAYGVYQLGAAMDAGMLQGRLFQSGWNLLFFALASAAIALKLNWHNSRSGYWLNLIMVSATDIGFILYVLMPGHLPLFPGIIGPLLWLAAAALSTAAYRRRSMDSG